MARKKPVKKGRHGELQAIAGIAGFTTALTASGLLSGNVGEVVVIGPIAGMSLFELGQEIRQNRKKIREVI
jgi:hypothetical protein